MFLNLFLVTVSSSELSAFEHRKLCWLHGERSLPIGLLVSYFSTKTYVVSTQKNRLKETGFFEHPKHMLKLMGKKIFTLLRTNVF